MTRGLIHVALTSAFVFATGSVALSQIEGTVLDASTSQPIADAIVSLQASSIRTTTDAHGRFELLEATGTGLVLVAARKGFFNGSILTDTPAEDLIVRIERVPAHDDPTYTPLEPWTCGGCHPDQLEQWLDSPMARAGLNTWLYDIYDGTGTPGGQNGFVYVRDSIHAPNQPESDCASCHQPETWMHEPFQALDDIDSLSPAAVHGVSCEVCHKIADIDVSRSNYPGLYPGVVTLTRPAGPDFPQVEYGLLGDATYRFPTLMRASYQPQLAADVCSACHQDRNDPDEDGDFEEPGGVVSEPTYLEWRSSPYGDPEDPRYSPCVNCHMPSFGGEQVCNVLFPPLRRDPATIRSHRLEGTTPEFLENAVTLRLSCVIKADRLHADVSITNDRTGHHVPTGVTIRNMILLIEAWREEDGRHLEPVSTQIIHKLGGVGPREQGYWAGLPGKLYAKVNHGPDGQGPVFFTEARGLLLDTRIPALKTDTTHYRFKTPKGGGTLHVRARLIYRRAFRFLVDAKSWTEDGHGRPLEDLQSPHFGHLMEEAEWVGSRMSIRDVPVRRR